MNPLPPAVISPAREPASLALDEIYQVLFRRKLPILACIAGGVGLGLAAYFLRPPPYQSEAKLFIRYVAETKDPASAGAVATAKSPDQRGETILDSETEIITSWDLARQVAEAVGPAVLLGRPAGPESLVAAATVVKSHLIVDVPPRSSVIRLTFQHDDPAVAQQVLREIIDRYLKLHLEVHNTIGLAGGFLSEETNQLRARLARTDEELRRLHHQAGVLSVDDARKADADQLAALRQQIFATRSELAEHTAIMTELGKQVPARAAPAAAEAPPPPETASAHADTVNRLAVLRRTEQELLAQFLPGTARVQAVRSQIAEAEAARRRLEEEFPALAAAGAGPVPGTAPADDPQARAAATLTTEAIRVAALQSRLGTLNDQAAELRAEAARVDELAVTLAELRRAKDLDEANYRVYAASLEQARIGEALGANRVSNISEIQKPSPPRRDRSASPAGIPPDPGGGRATRPSGCGAGGVPERWSDEESFTGWRI